MTLAQRLDGGEGMCPGDVWGGGGGGERGVAPLALAKC